MRSLLLAVALVLSSFSRTSAQDTNPRQHQFLKYYAGKATNSWKVNGRSGPQDYFNVDFGSSADGKVLTAILADFLNTSSFAGKAGLGVYENCAPGVPNLSAALTTRTAAVPGDDHFNDDDCYSLPCVPALSPANGYSVAVHMPAGDSKVWLSSDSSGGSGTTSFFTATAYAGCTSQPFTGIDFHVALGIHPPVGLMVNGGSSAHVEQNGGEACLVFYGPAFHTPGVLFVLSPVVQRVLFVATDGPLPGPCPNSWALCNTFQCTDPAPLSLVFGHFYLDFTDLGPRGNPKIKLTQASLDVDVSLRCLPHFGRRDDCTLDGSVWRVTNPAGPSDWFDVNQGTTDGVGVHRFTGLEVSSWDFCGTGPSWAEVGAYHSNLALDPAGCTMDPSNPVTLANNASMPPNAGDWGCPSTFYDVPDTAVSSGTIYHSAVHWPSGDTCIWLGSDTNGTDSELGEPIPNNGCCSLYSLDGYASPGVPFRSANWMMRVLWD